MIAILEHFGWRAAGLRPWLAAIAAMSFGLGLYQYDDMCEGMSEGSLLKPFLNAIEVIVLGPGLGLSIFVLMRYSDQRERLHGREVALERERRFRMLGRIAASVAHEIRNPLHNLRLIEEGLRASPADERLLARLRHSVDRLDQAVQLVHELSRPIRLADVELERVPLTAAVASVIEDVRERTRTDRLVDRVSASDPLFVRARHDALRMILDNLIRNGLEATSAGIVTVTHEVHDAGVDLVVSNPGSLPPDVFAAAASPKPQGFGVGLSIAWHLASSIGARLSLRGTDGLVAARLTLIKDEPL